MTNPLFKEVQAWLMRDITYNPTQTPHSTHLLVMCSLHLLELRLLVDLLLLNVDKHQLADGLADCGNAGVSRLEVSHVHICVTAVLARLLVVELQSMLVCDPV